MVTRVTLIIIIIITFVRDGNVSGYDVSSLIMRMAMSKNSDNYQIYSSRII